MQKLNFYKRIIIYSTIATIFGIILGFAISLSTYNTSVDPHIYIDRNLSTMITLLSIIITLGVAYSFFNIYKTTQEYESQKKRIDSIQNNQKKNISLLKESIAMSKKEILKTTIESEIRIELLRKKFEAHTYFGYRKFLKSLKLELEIVVSVLNNYEVLSNHTLNTADEFKNTIGICRSQISRNILTLFETLTNNKINKIKSSEIDDTIKYITIAMENITVYKDLISANEYQRYSFLFKMIRDLLGKIENKQLPFTVSDEDKYKLIFYYSDIPVGELSDENSGFDSWKNKYKENEEREKIEQSIINI